MTNHGLKIYDLLKGTHVRQTMSFLNGSQYWDLEDLRALQEEKLGSLLNGALAEVQYYRVRGTGNERRGDDNNWTMDRWNDWPIVDRQMVMEAGDTLISDKINIKQCKVGRTGGTTGPPLRIYRDQETRSWALAAYYRFYGWMGIEPGMPEVELWGSTNIGALKTEDRATKTENRKLIQNLKLKTQKFIQYPAPGIGNLISHFRSYNAFSFNEAYLEEVTRKIQRFKPKLIRGYLSAILLLADHIKRNNIKGIHPIAVSCTSETLFPEYRKMIEEVFQAPLFNQYGCGECNSIAFECREHSGMHITMEHCILEQDENNNLIVTNLDNYSQPFIRYKNGDIGEIDHSPCVCGSFAPRLTKLQGRANENIILKDGSSVNGIFFANLLDQAGFINSYKMLRFQVVQEKAGEIQFRAEVKKALTDGDLGKLKGALMPFFNKVTINEHQYLDPGPGGKFRYIISDIK